MSNTTATIKHNEAKDGIEIHFPAKPNVAVLDHIKAQGFRWGKFNKCWYARISSRTIATAEKYGSLPSSLVSDELADKIAERNEAKSVRDYVNAQEEAQFESFERQL